MSLVILALAAYEGDGQHALKENAFCLTFHCLHTIWPYPLSFHCVSIDGCQDDGSDSLSVGSTRSGCAEHVSEFLQSRLNLKFMQMSLSSMQHMGLNKSNQNVKLGSGDQI